MPDVRKLVDTIVIVMMENRSFDHLLGFLSHESFDGRTDVDGLRQPCDDFAWDNPDAQGNLFAPTATPDGYVPCDLPHDRKLVAAQLNQGAMNGFIQAYFDSQGVDLTPVPMRFCSPQMVPVTAALARGYAVCDRWFASLPNDTWPNRLMSLSGTTLIDSTSALKPPTHLLPDQPTLFDWLESKNQAFELYVDAKPIADVGPPSGLLLMKSQWKHVARHAHTLDTLKARWQSDSPAPSVIYCEPFFNDFAIAIGLHGNCNHPPLPMAFGEEFLRRVYLALTSNPAKWARTMLVICYDEHGGFFDHVRPPSMRYELPATGLWDDPSPFETLGVRIPGIVVSPWVHEASAFHGLLDHTSILQLLVDRFGRPEDLAFFGDAPARKGHGVRSLSQVLTRDAPRLDIPPVPAAPVATSAETTAPAINEVARMFRAVIADRPKAALF